MNKLTELFISQLQKVKGEFVDNFENFLETIPKGIILVGNLSSKFQHLSEIITAKGFDIANPEEAMKSGQYKQKSFDECVLGITEPLFGIADTGTIVETSDYNKIRSLSLIPKVHLALLDANSIIPNIEQATKFLAQKHRVNDNVQRKIVLPSAITFITGPSRTADIEQTLTAGVHGPIRLAVHLVNL